MKYIKVIGVFAVLSIGADLLLIWLMICQGRVAVVSCHGVDGFDLSGGDDRVEARDFSAG
jgi:hypothetical protein